jgi:hypothetical protein
MAFGEGGWLPTAQHTGYCGGRHRMGASYVAALKFWFGDFEIDHRDLCVVGGE